MAVVGRTRKESCTNKKGDVHAQPQKLVAGEKDRTKQRGGGEEE